MKIKYNIYATHSKEYPWKAIYLFNVSIEIYNGHDFASTENKFVVMIRMWGEKWVGEAKKYHICIYREPELRLHMIVSYFTDQDVQINPPLEPQGG